MDENKKKAQILYGLALIFDFKFTEMVANIYLSVLKDLSAADLNSVVTSGLKSNRWKFMPKPGEFFTMGDIAILDDSRDAANLVWSAIAKFGRFNPGEAQKFVGGLAWAVIERMGGWASICEVNTGERGIFLAQFRDTAQSLSRKAEKGTVNIKPSLPPNRNVQRFTAVIGNHGKT